VPASGEETAMAIKEERGIRPSIRRNTTKKDRK